MNASASGPASVLVVDDDARILTVVSRALRDSGIAITGLSSPQKALGLLASEQFNVLLSDIEMPEISGHELAARARELCPGTVRIIMTGLRDQDAAVRAINEDEAFRFLAKPFSPEDLREAVLAAVERSRELDEQRQQASRADQRRLLLAELEREHPGITSVPPSADDEYAIDPGGLDQAADGLGWPPLDRLP